MRIYHSKLNQQLAQNLLPVWLIFGDEPWQKNDALDRIKQTAKSQGFDELIRFSKDDKFDFQQIQDEYQSLSLFSSLRIIEVDLGKGKLDEASGKVLIGLSEQIAEQGQSDVLLILHGGKLDAATSKKKWFKSLEKIGCYIPLYELEGKGLNIWLSQQCQRLNLRMDNQAQQLLIDFFSGNIPAFYQELEKLALLFDRQFISADDLQKLLIKQAKFTPFQLTDALLLGDLNKCMSILTQLKQEGVALAQLVWVVQKELRLLIEMKTRIAQGESTDSLFKEFRIWDKRKPIYNSALNQVSLNNCKLALSRLGKVDLLSKTTSDFDDYILLSDVCVSLYHADITNNLALDYETFA